MAIIRLDLELPQGSSDQPENGAGSAIVFLFGLAADGVYPALDVAAQAVGAYPAVSPLPVRAKKHAIGGLFSVALSVVLPRTAVSRHPALCSPDFPPAYPKK